MRASCESPWHFSAKPPRLEGLPPSHGAFLEACCSQQTSGCCCLASKAHQAPVCLGSVDIPTCRFHGARGFYPSPVRGTVLSWYGTRTAGGTSPRRFSPEACAGCASALRSRSRGLPEAPDHQEPAGGPRRRVAPGGSPARGARALCDNGAVWLWCVVVRLVWLGTWGPP